MAFPTTSILDNFNRADASDLGANWTTIGSNSYRVHSSAAQANQSAGVSPADYYNVSTYGADCEAYATIAVLPSTSGSGSAFQSILIRFHDLGGGSLNGYELALQGWNGTNYTEARLYKVSNGGTLNSPISITAGAGDKLGVSAIGDTISMYLYSGGSWNLIGTVTNSDEFTTAGYLGFGGFFGGGSETAAWDDFGGGTISTGPAIPVYMNQYRLRRV